MDARRREESSLPGDQSLVGRSLAALDHQRRPANCRLSPPRQVASRGGPRRGRKSAAGEVTLLPNKAPLGLTGRARRKSQIGEKRAGGGRGPRWSREGSKRFRLAGASAAWMHIGHTSLALQPAKHALEGDHLGRQPGTGPRATGKQKFLPLRSRATYLPLPASGGLDPLPVSIALETFVAGPGMAGKSSLDGPLLLPLIIWLSPRPIPCLPTTFPSQSRGFSHSTCRITKPPDSPQVITLLHGEAYSSDRVWLCPRGRLTR
jgi:hypothetical protein